MLWLALLFWPASAAGQDPFQDPVITRGPYLQAADETSVLVQWRTDKPVSAAVEVETAPMQFTLFEEGVVVIEHQIRIVGLRPGTRYSYRLLHEKVPVKETDRFFRTAPPAGTGFVRCAVVGDSGTGDGTQIAVAGVMSRMDPHIFIHTGDLDYLGDVDKSVFGPFRDLLSRAPFFPCMGNHDFFLPWRGLFPMEFPPEAENKDDGHFLSYDWGPAHFVILDTETGFFPNTVQMRWFEADLAAARQRKAPWIIVYFHQPLFTVGAYSAGFEPQFRQAVFLPIAQQYGVDLVLNGHDHNYQRSHPVQFVGLADGLPLVEVHDAWQSPSFRSPGHLINVVTGGGGRFLYSEVPNSDHRFTERFLEEHHALEMEITPARLSLRAISADERVVDEFEIRKDVLRLGPAYVRGDVTLDRAVGLSDAISVLNHLFFGEALLCPGVADANASDGVNITDPIFLLNHLFLGEAPPAAPYPDCGTEPLLDDRWCYRIEC